jgi:hypothetical protein
MDCAYERSKSTVWSHAVSIGSTPRPAENFCLSIRPLFWERPNGLIELKNMHISHSSREVRMPCRKTTAISMPGVLGGEGAQPLGRSMTDLLDLFAMLHYNRPYLE